MTTERRTITQPAEWWRAFEKQAKTEGVSLSHWIGNAGLNMLAADDIGRLPNRTPAHRPRKQPD